MNCNLEGGGEEEPMEEEEEEELYGRLYRVLDCVN